MLDRIDGRLNQMDSRLDQMNSNQQILLNNQKYLASTAQQLIEANARQELILQQLISKVNWLLEKWGRGDTFGVPTPHNT